MYGIGVSLDEPRAPIDAQFSITDRFCKFDDMSRRQEGASLNIFVNLLDQLLLLHNRELSRAEVLWEACTRVSRSSREDFETPHKSATFYSCNEGCLSSD